MKRIARDQLEGDATGRTRTLQDLVHAFEKTGEAVTANQLRRVEDGSERSGTAIRSQIEALQSDHLVREVKKRVPVTAYVPDPPADPDLMRRRLAGRILRPLDAAAFLAERRSQTVAHCTRCGAVFAPLFPRLPVNRCRKCGGLARSVYYSLL